MNERGFTLAELLVTMAVTGLILAGVFALQQTGQYAYLAGAARAETQQNARTALDRMTRELRTGSQVTAATNCDLGTNAITFVYVDAAGVNVTARYYLDGANLMRNQTAPVVAGQPESVIGGVDAMTIVCFDANDIATATLANVRSVDIRVTARGEGTSYHGGQANPHAIVASRVRMRNL